MPVVLQMHACTARARYVRTDEVVTIFAECAFNYCAPYAYISDGLETVHYHAREIFAIIVMTRSVPGNV